MDRRSTNRFENFKKSLRALAEARKRDPGDEFVLSGTVQKFNLTFDIAWKVMKDLCVQYFKMLDFASGSPRETLRMARSVNLIADDQWMAMLNDRNELAHDYDGSIARMRFDTILNVYLPLIEEFRDVAAGYYTFE